MQEDDASAELIDLEPTKEFVSPLRDEIVRIQSKDTSFIARAIVISIIVVPFFNAIVIILVPDAKVAVITDVYKAWLTLIAPVLGTVLGATVAYSTLIRRH